MKFRILLIKQSGGISPQQIIDHIKTTQMYALRKIEVVIYPEDNSYTYEIWEVIE